MDDSKIEQMFAGLTKTLDRLAEEHRKTEATVKSLAEEHKKTEEAMREANKHLAGIGKSQGDVAEDLYRRALGPLMQKRGIKLDRVIGNFMVSGKHQEYDLLGTNGKFVVLGEVKYKLTNEDVRYFLNSQIPAFRREFREYKDLKLIGVVAGLVIKENVEKYAVNQGLYILAQNGEGSAEIINDPKFQAKYF